MKCAMFVLVLAICLASSTGCIGKNPNEGRLHAPPVNEGAVHEENKAVAVNSHNRAIAKSTSKAIWSNIAKSTSKLERVAKEVVQQNNRTFATKRAGLLALTSGPAGIKPAAKEIVQKNGTNWGWASPHDDGPHPSSWFGFEWPTDNNSAQAFAIYTGHKNGSKPAAKEVELLAHKNATQPVTTEVKHKNATKPAIKQVERLVHNDVSTPAMKEVWQKNVMTLQIAKIWESTPPANEDAAEGAALLAQWNKANLVAKEVAHKNGGQPAVNKLTLRVPKNAMTSAEREITHKNGTKPTVIEVAHKNSTKSMTEIVTVAPPKSRIDQGRNSILQSDLKQVS